MLSKNYTFTYCFVWVWKLVPDIKGRAWIRDISEQGAEENMWSFEG
jgi:hypothetical protein